MKKREIKQKINNRKKIGILKKIKFYDWCLIIPPVLILFLILGILGLPLAWRPIITTIFIDIPLWLFYLGMLYNMIKRGNWIWFILTLVVSYASYEYENGNLYGYGLFIALLFYGLVLRREKDKVN